MSRRLIAALLVTGALSGILVAVVVRPRISGVLPSFGGKASVTTLPPDPYVSLVAQATAKQVAVYDAPGMTTPSSTAGQPH